MKIRILSISTLLCLALSLPASALEYLWTDHHGSRHFDCGGFVVGGEAAIKDLGRGRYRARGVLIDREIQARSIYHAAQIACGVSDEFESNQPAQEPAQQTK